jgi:hypothetical protein
MFLASQAHAISAQKDGRKIRRQTNQTTLEPLGGRREEQLRRQTLTRGRFGQKRCVSAGTKRPLSAKLRPLHRQPQSSPALFAFCTTTSDKVEPGPTNSISYSENGQVHTCNSSRPGTQMRQDLAANQLTPMRKRLSARPKHR